MSSLMTNIGTILTNLIDWFTQIGSYLITNPIFIIILSVAIFSVLFYNLVGIIKRNRANKKYKSMENWLNREVEEGEDND